MTMTSNANFGQFGDTTLTKVFVGGLAWETPKEVLKDHFDKYGNILEAVIICDKITGRSKGYGFVTFKEPEEAKKACEDATPIINGRRANCNLASLGAKRPRSSPASPPQHGAYVGARCRATSPAPVNQVQWYYPAVHGNQQPHYHQPIPNYYGYTPTPTYIATDVSYNHKLGYSSNAYMNGQYYGSGQAMVGGNTLMPMYPIYQTHSMGLPAPHHYYPAPRLLTGPPLISKPTSFLPNSGTTDGVVEMKRQSS